MSYDTMSYWKDPSFHDHPEINVLCQIFKINDVQIELSSNLSITVLCGLA